ncbi:hypothetical protein L1887_24668 [Cichorium endivia]|nr:hypothetical protein L1887_24668 [Cichorium endivia]
MASPASETTPTSVDNYLSKIDPLQVRSPLPLFTIIENPQRNPGHQRYFQRTSSSTIEPPRSHHHCVNRDCELIVQRI